jgi:hypothetical protein
VHASSAQAMCMAVGKVSLDDWLMLQWSLGWTGDFEPISPPSISMARLEITSLAFMLDWVPEPVCQTTSGKCRRACRRSPPARRRRWPCPASASSLPRSMLVSAQARLTMPRARTMGAGCFSQPILKLKEFSAHLGHRSFSSSASVWGAIGAQQRQASRSVSDLIEPFVTAVRRA